ncbi:MAG TPA: MarR family transcriptional regulator [Acidimicrobiales bacterium]|nr:MarR family transcriptional regulator [Acidimicrobiales bacterium]
MSERTTTRDDLLDDERMTLTGLLVESGEGLKEVLHRHLVDECGLTIQSFVLLLRLSRSPERRLRMSDLADQTGLTPSGLTRAIDRLAQAGLVERLPCPDDRRGSYAALTTEGLTRVRAAVQPHLRHLDEEFVGRLTPDERDDLARILRKVRDHVNPGAARPPEPI